MHPALECDDIFRAICLASMQGVTVKGPVWLVIRSQTGQTGTLAALATTCKALSEPALDVLWEELDNIVWVFDLFPPDLFVESRSEPTRLTRPIMPTDWDRPLLYVPRVKKLSLRLDWGWVEVLKVMGLFYPNGGLLPNLRHLECSWEADFMSLRVLLHPQLKEISFSFPPSITNLSVLSALPVLCPHLTGVDLRFEEGDDCPSETAVVISSLLSALEALQSLHLGARMHIGALNPSLLPSLTTLYLEGEMELVAGSFPCLQRLRMWSVDTVSVIEMFRSVTDIDLVYLNLYLSSPATTSQMAEFVHALPNVASPASLQTLWLSEAQGMQENVMTAAILRELSFFRALTSVKIGWTLGPDVDDATLEILTASWSHLTDLSLEPCQVDTSNLTLRSLLALARNCPRLEDLFLQLDAREVPELPPVAPQRSLKRMRVFSSPIENATKVARYLSGIFPDVEDISSSHPEKIRESNLWNQVSEQLPEFVALRKEVAEQIRGG